MPVKGLYQISDPSVRATEALKAAAETYSRMDKKTTQITKKKGDKSIGGAMMAGLGGLSMIAAMGATGGGAAALSSLGLTAGSSTTLGLGAVFGAASYFLS